MNHKFSIGDIVELKKQHPCGSKEWEVTRVGVDFKLKCLAVTIRLMIPRPKLKKVLKR